ncbi:MAG TPA: glycerophosphodiester phosphodiesterase family protein [Novosphingobium sp.]|nr:glycerophosphodiester phosphodiesterase family protein [Novosphingobium sp.]HQA16846.1 glycerophosphodiester phosphodiesterase family protein [Novosphingobium sp.]
MLFALPDRWLAPPPKPDKVGWLGSAVYAHRGLHHTGVPENSLSAFRAAIDRGMGIECDVQRSVDGQAMVFHDFELDRLTAKSGPVAQQTAQALGTIELSGSHDRIPTLRRMLEEVAGRVPILIEIKSRRGSFKHAGALCQAVRRTLEGYVGPHAIMSFDPRVVRWFADRSPLTVRGLVVTEENDKALAGMIRRRLFLWRAKPDFLAYDIRDLPSRFAAGQRRRGLPVLTWTVRSPEHLERAASHADAPIAEGAGVA